jgi:hypothetical protein
MVPRALGASAVLTHNLLLMAGFVLTGLAGYALGTRVSGDRLAGLLAGSLVAFGPHTLPRIAHLQAQWLMALPLSLLALDSVIRKRTWGPALTLGVWVGLLAMTLGLRPGHGSRGDRRGVAGARRRLVETLAGPCTTPCRGGPSVSSSRDSRAAALPARGRRARDSQGCSGNRFGGRPPNQLRLDACEVSLWSLEPSFRPTAGGALRA